MPFNEVRKAPLSVRQAIQLTARRVADSGIFFDFDGTLAPIQADPASVQPVPGIRAVLARLATTVKRLGVISARPVDFLKPHFQGIDGICLHGLYGLEVMNADASVGIHEGADSWMPTVRRLVSEAASDLPPAVRIEDKRLSLALHYRAAPECQGVIEQWARAQSKRTGLAVREGRMTFELVPPLNRDKGSVLREEIDDLSCAWYFGDDLSDLDAFRALAERESQREGFIGVRVAVANREVGQRLAGAADFSIESPEDVLPFLSRLAAELGSPAVEK
ncbi:MAG: trehalose-phosphatase [Egibacteraceae bacterium]